MKRKSFPAALCAVCLLVLVLLTGLLFSFFVFPPAARVDAPAVLVLDDAWTDRLLAQPDEKSRKAFIEEVPAQAEALGCDGVLLTPRTADGALFRDRTDTLPPDPALDGLDVTALLKKQLARADIAFYLLAADEEGVPYPLDGAPEWALTLAEKKHPAVLFAGMAPGFFTALRGAVPLTDGKELTLLDGLSPASLAASRQNGVGGVLGRWADLTTDDADAVRLAAFAPPEKALPNTTLPRTPAICSHPDGFTSYYETLCLTGTSDPARDLTLNGGPVDRPGADGVWSKAVTLTEGDNVFTLEQGDESQTITVHYVTSWDWTPTEPEPDDTVKAKKGQWARVTADGITSLLADYEDSSAILATVPQGAVVQVADSEEFQRSGKLTWAYRLHNGGWLRATGVELLEKDDPAAAPAVFDSLTCAPLEDGEVWTLHGAGSPLFLEERGEDGSLTLTFCDAEYTGEAPAPGGLAREVTPGLPENGDQEGTAYPGFTLHFAFAEDAPLWGYVVSYTEAGVEIRLKAAPSLGEDPARPLEGVTVLLDVGHGDQDNGAPGCAGQTGPLEKDLNLALGLAARTRLEQLGASVTLSRSDDTFLTLAQRLELVNQQCPDFFISLHHNSIDLYRDTADINGTECYWFTPQSRELAAVLTANFAAAYGCNDRGAKEDYYFVTRTTACPAVLLESGFLTTALEYERCADETALWAGGGEIAEAIVSVLGE